MANACCDNAIEDLESAIDDAEGERGDLQVGYALAAAAQDWDLAEEIVEQIEIIDIEVALMEAQKSGVSTGCGCCS